jgi:hypothetical protein
MESNGLKVLSIIPTINNKEYRMAFPMAHKFHIFKE